MPRALLVRCCTALWTAALCSTAVPVPAAGAGPPPAYLAPVDAPVSDPFRPPTSPYGPGNRGLEYATSPGTPVGAAATGTVSFAGSVAGSLHVTVRHDDGVRTTYSFLARVDVVIGQRVGQGQVVGLTAGALHFSARRGDAYFDPATLFAGGSVRVRLVPFDLPPGLGAGGERSAIAQLVGGIGGVLHEVSTAPGALAGWLRADGAEALTALAHYGSRFSHPSMLLDAASMLAGAWWRAEHAAGRPCTGAGTDPPPPTSRRVVVLVAGLGSHSRGSTADRIRTDELGYAPADVLRFSYAGGRVPDASDGFVSIPATAYDAPETQADLRVTAGRLAELLEAVAAAAPGAPLDLFAHSQGGVVVRLALLELERRHGAAWLDRLGLVATLGSPHGGADLATAVHALASTGRGDLALEAFGALTDQELDDDGASVAQLSETSDVVAELAAHPVPASVTALSIAARGDLVVPVPRTLAPGMEPVVVPLAGRSAHSALPGSPEATRELALGLAGLPPTCQPFREALLDQVHGEGISLVQDLAGAVGLVAAG